MKNIIAVLLLLIMGNSMVAQTPVKAVPGINKAHHDAIMQLLQNSGHVINSERTSTYVIDTVQYVIAQSIRDSTMAITDSIYLGYGSIKKSTYDYNNMVYPYNYPYNTSPMFNFKGNFTKPFVYYDTFYHWATDPYTLLYGYFETWYASYNSSSDLNAFKKVYVDSSLIQNMSFVNKFNAANNIDSGYWFNDMAGVSDSAFIQYFSYSASNKVTEDSIYELHRGNWYIVSKCYYTYDGLGDLTQIDYYANDTDTTFAPGFPEQVQYVNTYDVIHRLLTVLTSVHNGTALQPFARDSFAYGSGVGAHNTWVEWEYDMINGFWTPYFNENKQLNSLGLPDTILTQSWDSVSAAWVPQSMFLTYYNSRNNPDTLKEFDYNYTYYPTIPSYFTVYYYNIAYDSVPTTTVSYTNMPEIQVSSYPNPTAENENVVINHYPDGKPVYILLMNSLGQIVMKETCYQPNGTFQVVMNNLVPGTYTLLVNDINGTTFYSHKLLKQ